MIIGKHVEKIVKDDKVILANKETGTWTRMSDEVYEILKLLLADGDSIESLHSAFEINDDYIFIKNLYDSLVDSNIICSEEYQPNKQNKIVSIQLTNRCNLKCIHCCVDAESAANDNLDLTTAQIKSIFDKVINWNPLNIMLSGGEPMIRNDFIELLTYLREKYKGKIILSTNSLFIHKENVKILTLCCDSFEISIDGIDEETCSIVRGPGVFNKVCKNIQLLKSFGAANINLSMVFSDRNQYLEDQFYKLNEKLGTKAVCRLFSAIGRGALNKSVFSDKSNEDIYIPSDYLAEQYDKPFGISFCSAGNRELFIGFDGALYPCPSYMQDEFVMGNVLDCENINDLLKSDKEQYSEYIAQAHPQKLSTCSNCQVRHFCWTCPGELRDITTKEAFQARCNLLKPVLMKRVWEQELSF